MARTPDSASVAVCCRSRLSDADTGGSELQVGSRCHRTRRDGKNRTDLRWRPMNPHSPGGGTQSPPKTDLQVEQVGLMPHCHVFIT